MKLCYLALAALLSSSLFALPRPTAASYAKGVQFEVAGYTNANGTARSEALAGFPVLVRIANDSPSGFAYSQLQSSSDGADLCFIDMAGNGLPFEIDTWNPDGTSLIWVTLPSMGQGTQFVMCWGGATSGKTVCGDNPFAGYKGVWHMNATSPADASGSGNNGTATGSPTVSSSGAIGKALSLPTTSDYVTCGMHQSNAELKDAFTVETWVNPASYSGNRCVFGKDKFISIRTESQTKINVTTPGKKDHPFDKMSLPNTGIWWHLVVTFQKNTSSGCKIYTNGVFAAQQYANDIDNQTTATEMWFGKNQWGQNYTGLLDEIRLSAGIKSADWIAATYATQSDSTFLTAGEAQEYEASAAPGLGLVAPPSAVHYTNVTLTATISSLGMNDGMTTDADWVDPLLVVSMNDDLSNPLFSIPLDRVSSVPVSVPIAVLPLVTNTTYYAQLLATNSFNVAGESGVAQFTTLDPGAPVGTAILMDRGFSTMTATTTVTSFGVGGESATVRLEASTDGFETVVAGEEQTAVIDVATQLSVSNLVANTAYSLRVRIRNDWGLETYLPLPDSYTRAVPFATTGIGWQFSQDGSMIDITFGVSGVYDGAGGTATLTYNGVERGEQAITGPCELSWPNITAASGTATATVVLSATLNGHPYTQTFTASIASGSTAVSISDIMDYQSAESSVRIRVGDVITLPELSGTSFYYLGNNRFGSLEGNVLTATEPGILGVFCVTDEGATTNTLPVIVLPEPIGSGSIYILKDGQIGNGWANWDDASKWEKVGSSTNDSWPRNSDDVAIAAYWQNTGTIQMEPRSGDISLGALYVGNFRDAESKFSIRNNNKVIFARTDGKPALIQFCANDRLTAKTASVTFASSIVGVEFTCDTVVDGGWDGIANNCPAATFEFKAPYFLLPEGKTLLFQNFSPTRGGEGTSFGQPFTGGGLVWNRSAANFNWTEQSLAGFAGTLRDSSHGAASFGYQAPLFVRSPGSNTVAEVVGFVSANSDANPQTSASSVGIMQTGFNQGYRDALIHQDPWFTGRGLLLHGGTYQANAVEHIWGYGAADKKISDVLTLSGGLNFLSRSWSRDQLSGYPINWVEFKSVAHEDKSSLVLWGDLWSNGGASTADKTITIDVPKGGPVITETILAGSVRTNHVMILSGVSSQAVGPNGDPLASATHPVVPWMLMPRTNSSSGWGELGFASFDDDDRLVSAPKVVSVTSLTADEAVGANVTFWDRTIEISKDVTVNSLELGNQNKNKWLGTGRTLTISSGGLVLRNQSSAIGLSGRTDNGSLVLGDATHPAYVWARSSSASNPNQIWADVTAPGGFVAAYTGYLTLGGSQTNIADEIAVNAGTLALGDADHSCTLAAELPIRIFANATLKLPNDSSTTTSILKFDGAAGWFGKVEVPAGVAAKCRRAYWRDYPETQEWQVLKRGVYGSSESGAPNVRDDLFVGAGTLQILRDDSAMPFFIMVR